jgi:putative hemolysin
MSRSVAREISYATSVKSKGAQVFVRTVENATGRLRLIRQAAGYEDEVAAGRNFWEVMAERYRLSLQVTRGALDNIPTSGPLVLLSNHPYGILDGLMMGYILSKTRGDFRILAHRVFRKAEDINRVILPISFDETKEALALNLETRKTALKYLADGGAIGIFPGGTVSTATRPFGFPADPGWRTFTAKMIAKSDATVVPIFFEGHNSRLFQVASHLHYTLRTALFVKEFKKRVGSPVRVVIGEPLRRSDLETYAKDPRGMMDFLRTQTYSLSPEPVRDFGYGFEFEEKHKRDGGRSI